MELATDEEDFAEDELRMEELLGIDDDDSMISSELEISFELEVSGAGDELASSPHAMNMQAIENNAIALRIVVLLYYGQILCAQLRADPVVRVGDGTGNLVDFLAFS